MNKSTTGYQMIEMGETEKRDKDRDGQKGDKVETRMQRKANSQVHTDCGKHNVVPKTESKPPYGPVVPLLGIYPKRMENAL